VVPVVRRGVASLSSILDSAGSEGGGRGDDAGMVEADADDVEGAAAAAIDECISSCFLGGWADGSCAELERGASAACDSISCCGLVVGESKREREGITIEQGFGAVADGEDVEAETEDDASELPEVTGELRGEEEEELDRG